MPGAVDTISAHCLAVRLRLINRVVSGLYDEALGELGLKVSQVNVLVAIAKRERIKPRDLARLLYMDPSTVSRNVERMAKRGWIHTEADADSRSHWLSLTPAGQTLLEEVLPRWREAQSQAEELLGKSGEGALRRVAARLWDEVQLT